MIYSSFFDRNKSYKSEYVRFGRKLKSCHIYGLFVQRLGHSPVTAETRVQLSYKSPLEGQPIKPIRID